MVHNESHRTHRTGWLRASVLGANDGIVSTASLIIGVAAAGSSRESILLAGAAGLVAGAMSMAAGEYVSVKSQADTEKADLEIERRSLEKNYDLEIDELAIIYQKRGVKPELAEQVAEQMMAHDALGAHARDDIGISDSQRARPTLAAISSMITFTVGAALPLSIVWLSPLSSLIYWVALLSLLFLCTLGAIAARAGGAPVLRASLRVCFWGALAMALTAGVGILFGISA